MEIEQLYNEYFSVVYRYVLCISRDSGLAEEITQDTFFKALKKIDSFRDECSIRVWLCQIAKNSYFDHLKRQARYSKLPEELSEEYGENGTSVEESYLAKVEAKEIHKILHNLKEPYKEVFSLRTFGELSFAEIGELFGKSDSWARVTFHRARMMIREKM